MPRISIILCTRNREEALRETLQSLRQVEVASHLTAEVVFVDNGSTDGTRQVMQSFTHPHMDVRVVVEEEPGVSNARNRGVREAAGDVLIFTDDDMRFPEDWLIAMSRPILEGAADAVAGGVVIPPALQRTWMLPVHRSWMASTEEIDPSSPHRLVGANMAIARRVFDVVQGFDPELGAGALGYGEETLFTAQLRKAGFRVAAAFDVAVEHHFDPSRLTRKNYLRMACNMGRSQAYVRHHWQHDRPSLLTSLYEIVGRTVQLGYWRITRRGDIGEEGAPMWELSTLRKLYTHVQFLAEWGKAPRYSKKKFAKDKRRIKGAAPSSTELSA